jgi:pyridinium-3,5-bisthiocarboxylic acid mononucleotide nickel chelatase
MKILYYDCFSGISGDMNMAALVDLGVDKTYLVDELRKLNLGGYTISFVPDQRKGITGTRADVNITNDSHDHGHDHGHSHGHEHSHQEHKHFTFDALKSLTRKHPHHEHIHQHDRDFADIRKLIMDSTLNENVKNISIQIFQKIAEAEAHVHGKPIDEIHFHEVGAVDSIVDIVGAAICIDFLKPDKIISSPVQLGGGTVKCAHGTFPVPAPATLEILKDKPVKLGAVQVETTTPTGAAIIATLVTEFTDQPNFNINKIAYGIGHRDNAIPNVLRVCLAEPKETVLNENKSASTMLECNIDDMNPEMYEYIMEKLFEAGADDVYFQPIIMKKTRPAITIGILCKTELVPIMEHIILSETSTLGLRKYQVQKSMLNRDWKTVDTPWGQVRVKLGYLNDKLIKSKPEYEDCLRISRENNVPIADVYRFIADHNLS